ncbi:MAG: NnrS family protein [Rickettsiaceae bacterium]|nr:NnrS family protein [Rickettsiaceae bacterium]
MINKLKIDLAKSIPLLQLAFRPFFLSGSLFGMIAILIWISILNGQLDLNFYSNSYWWHSHEMLFGFVVAIIVGFVLTAVQTWTGQPSIKGAALLGLWLLWFAARIILAINFELNKYFIAIIDLSFLPLVALYMSYLILLVRQWRNLIFVPLLLLMTIANSTMHYGAFTSNASLITHGSYSMIMIITMVMTIIAGRIIPMFTANGTKTPKVESIKIIEILTLLSTMALMLVYISGFKLSPLLYFFALFFSAICHLVRFTRWRFWITFKYPLLWSLHISYFCIPLGFILMSISYVSKSIPLSITVHCLTIGAISGMILSMICRVSLGHTGRKLVVGKVITVSFILIFLSFLVRVFGSFVFNNYISTIYLSAFLWIIAFSIFFVSYLPILCSSRATT